MAGIGQGLPAPPQDRVAINIDLDLAEWLVGTIVGQSSFSGDLEETVTTILRVIKRDLSPDALRHLQRAGTGAVWASRGANWEPGFWSTATADSGRFATSSPQAEADRAEQLSISAGFSGSPVCGKFGSFGVYYGNV